MYTVNSYPKLSGSTVMIVIKTKWMQCWTLRCQLQVP